MADTRIEWATKTWNPVTGCRQISPGCDYCYAKTIAEELQGKGYRSYARGFDVTLQRHRLLDPHDWFEPERVFVNSMSDLFHKDIPDWYLKQIWEVMKDAKLHTYMILTKRMHRAVKRIRDLELALAKHIWIGTSVENQKFADNRIPSLITLDASVKFLSCEPLLGPVDLSPWLFPEPQIDWVIVGGESGLHHRKIDADWARTIRDQCQNAGVPFFFKQWGGQYWWSGGKELDGQDWLEFPRTYEPRTSTKGK